MPDGSVTVTCDGEEETPRTPEWVPQFIEMLQDPLVKGIQMPFSTPLYPQYLVHSPDTIYDSASYTHWDINGSDLKDELRRVQPGIASGNLGQMYFRASRAKDALAEGAG